MLADITVNIMYCAIVVFFYKHIENKKDMPKNIFGILVFIAAAIRLLFAMQNYYFTFDVHTFMAWGNYAVDYGFNQMYRQGFFMDYPPGYMYVLYLITRLMRLLGIEKGNILYIFFLKLPAIIADFGCAFILYSVAKEKREKAFAKFLCLVFLFMPVVILNSSVWGQVESFYIFFVVLSIYFAYKNKTVFAGISYAYALLVKPQALLFGPVLFFYIIKRADIKEFFKAVGSGVISLYVMVLPFCNGLFDIGWIFELYKNTVGGYKYFTVNAYNLYYAFGLNWVDITHSSTLVNGFFIIISVIIAGIIVMKSKEKSSLFSAAMCLITIIFAFCTMMHERYIYPAVLLSLICFAIDKKIIYLVFSLVVGIINYFNVRCVLASYVSEFYVNEIYGKIAGFAMTISTIVIVGYLLYQIFKNDKINIKKSNYWLVGIIVVYSVFAFEGLGSVKAPQTFFQSDENNTGFSIKFDQMEEINSIYAYSGIGDKSILNQGNAVGGAFEILYSTDGKNFEHLCDLTMDTVYTWKEQYEPVYATDVMIKAKNQGDVLYEIVFTDSNGEIIRGKVHSYADTEYDGWNAVDESHFLPEDTSYYYSMYFDEIYHARTAYEQLKGYDVYETTHPPLGKIMISLGIAIFGMTPFGWRIIGVLCGIAMIPIMYFLIKKLSDNKWIALVAAALLSLDFMHLTQTRIATVDTYVVFFVMLTFLFMAYYYKTAFKDKKEWLYLALSGIFMGCAISSKWNGVYPMVALAVLFFMSIFAKYKNSSKEKVDKNYVIKTLALCCVFFVVVPLFIYCLSYIPVLRANSFGEYITKLIKSQIDMYNYHTKLEADHFFSSMWYTWPINLKPMWYTVTELKNGMVSSISAFGNPMIWILTPIASIYCIYKGIKYKKLPYLFVSLGYFSSYLPWVLVSRLCFIYHYFPCAVFGIMAIAFAIKDIVTSRESLKKYVFVYLVICLVLFIIFLPITTGMPITKDYLDFLEFMPDWHFIN